MIKNYYLNLDKLKDLSKEDKEYIHNYYRDLLHCVEEKRDIVSNSLFNTLYNGGYLVDIRSSKIDKILEE